MVCRPSRQQSRFFFKPSDRACSKCRIPYNSGGKYVWRSLHIASSSIMAVVLYTYGTWRAHAKGSLTWADLQPTQGSYTGSGSDQANMVLNWTAFDAAMTEADATGTVVCWNMYRTPAWASIAGDQIGGSNTVIGAWGDAGESAVPQKLQYLTDIVTKVLQRANNGRRRIAFVEPLNEPEFFDATALAAYIAGGSKPFWTGTAPQAVDYAWTVLQATKAVDSSIPVLMPSQYAITRIQSYLSAVGTVSGKIGWETFDWLNIHPYGATPNQSYGGGDLYNISGTTTGISQAMRALSAAGCPTTKPVAITEWGLASQYDARVAFFHSQTAAYRFSYMARLLAMAALNGVRLMMPFSYPATPPSNGLAGDWTNDTSGVIAAMTDVHTKLAGKTIVSGGCEPETGIVRVTLANGASYAW